MDPLKDFIADYCVVRPDVSVNNTAIWNAYEEWAKKHSGIKRPISQKSFSQRLESKGHLRGKSGSARVWHGIGLLANV